MATTTSVLLISMALGTHAMSLGGVSSAARPRDMAARLQLFGRRTAQAESAWTAGEQAEVVMGKCKFFDPSKGFGFLTVPASKLGQRARDIFVHKSDLKGISLMGGDKVAFRIAKNEATGKEKATHVWWATIAATAPTDHNWDLFDKDESEQIDELFDELFAA